MKAYLIDPAEQTVTTIETVGTLKSMYRNISCRYVESAVSWANGDLLYVDEEGHWNRAGETIGAFMLRMDDGRLRPFVGRGVVIGTDAEGDHASVKGELAALRERVTFMTPAEVLAVMKGRKS